MQSSFATITRVVRRVRALARVRVAPLPSDGYMEHRVSAPVLERLSDEELDRLNTLLPWACFTVDSRGRRFGNSAWTGKRDQPQVIPDYRIVLMDERFGLLGKRVLEIGCFEGVHTIGLCQRGAHVTAVDARVENVVNTVVRCAFHGCRPDVLTCDVESPDAMAELSALGVDLVHHVGVLYHLRDPITHVLELGTVAGGGLMLDTHVAPPDAATDTMVVRGETFPYMRYEEGGRPDVFSGMYDHAKWIPLATLVALLRQAGFNAVDVVEERAERNGPRVLIMAGR